MRPSSTPGAKRLRPEQKALACHAEPHMRPSRTPTPGAKRLRPELTRLVQLVQLARGEIGQLRRRPAWPLDNHARCTGAPQPEMDIQ